jgi:hypothetical protein
LVDDDDDDDDDGGITKNFMIYTGHLVLLEW